MKLKNPNLKELQDLEVAEDPQLQQPEKETIVLVDKETETIQFYTRIGTHIKTLLYSPNDEINITKAHTTEDNKLCQLSAELPLDSMTISIKKSPKKKGWLSNLLLS